jgi:hypothetical protein
MLDTNPFNVQRTLGEKTMFKIINMTKQTHWTDNGSWIEYHFSFNFNGKEDYLEQKAGWRAEYKELSSRIRKYKLYRKPRFRPSDLAAQAVEDTLSGMQSQARMMNQMIVQAKAESWRQKLATRKAA